MTRFCKHTIATCKVSYSNRVEIDLANSLATGKGGRRNPGDLLGDRNAFQRSTTAESARIDACASTILGKGDRPDLGEIGRTIRHIEHICRNMGDLGTEVNRNTLCISTYIVKYSTTLGKIGECNRIHVNLPNSGTIVESVLTKGCRALGDRDACKVGSISKCIFADNGTGTVRCKGNSDDLCRVTAVRVEEICRDLRDRSTDVERNTLTVLAGICKHLTGGGKVLHCVSIEVDLDKRSTTTESFRANTRHALRDSDACQSRTIVECVAADACDTLRNRNANQGLASPESGVANTRDLRRKQNAFQRGASVEGIVTDACNRGRKRDAFQRGARVKGIVANACNRGRKRDAFQRGASVKGIVANACNRGRIRDAFQRGASVEGIVTNTFANAVLRKSDRRDIDKRSAVRIEQIRRNLGDIGTDIDHDTLAIFASICKHGIVVCKIGHSDRIEIDLSQRRAIIEGIACKPRYTLGDRNAFQSGASSKGVLTDACNGIGKRSACQSGTAIKSKLTNNANAFMEHNTFHSGTIIECVFANSNNPLRDRNAFQSGASNEGILIDIRYAIGKHYTGKRSTTVKRRGANAFANATGSKGHTCQSRSPLEKTCRNLLHVRAYLQRKSFAILGNIIEYVRSQVVYFNSVEVDLGKCVTTAESLFTKNCDPLRYRNTCQSRAIIEGVFTNTGQVLRNHNIGKCPTTIEAVLTNSSYPLRNRETC